MFDYMKNENLKNFPNFVFEKLQNLQKSCENGPVKMCISLINVSIICYLFATFVFSTYNCIEKEVLGIQRYKELGVSPESLKVQILYLFTWKSYGIYFLRNIQEIPFIFRKFKVYYL